MQALQAIGVIYVIIGAIHSIAFELLISRTACLTGQGLVYVFCNWGKGISHAAIVLGWPLYWLS